MNKNAVRQKILIADDVAMNRELLSDLLCEQYDIIEAKDGNEALLALEKKSSEIALVLLDMVMPERSGLEVLKVMNENGWINEIPVVMISSETMPEIIESAYKMGATDFISRPFDQIVVQSRVRNTILLYNKQRQLSELVATQVLEKTRNNSLLITVLSHIVEFRNGESGLHVLHINIITNILMHALMKRSEKYRNLKNDIDIISTASSMHDIGKITIPDDILNKPGKFTPDEFNIMKQHSLNGANILDKVSFGKDEPLMKYAYQICRWHHERWDGRGYPDGLKGDDIPISAQIVSLADVYDALTSDRCYKKAYTHSRALEMIRNNECGTFNPVILECLNDVADDLPKELDRQSVSMTGDIDFAKVLDVMTSESQQNMYTRHFKQISYEQKKCKFFQNQLDGIAFEYTYNPRVLKFSPKGAKMLGLPQNIIDPGISRPWSSEDEVTNWNVLSAKLNNAAPEKDSFNFEAHLKINNEDVPCKIKIQQVWNMATEKPVPIAAYGHISLIN